MTKIERKLGLILLGLIMTLAILFSPSFFAKGGEGPTIASPSNFKATQWGYDLYLTWNPVEGAVSYEVSGGRTGTVLSVIEPTATSESATEFITSISQFKTGGGPYSNTYRVCAVDAAGNKSDPAEVSGTWQTGVSFSGRIQATAADTFYTGSPVTTTFLVTDIGGVAVTVDDYTVEYSNNTEVGTATAVLTGKKGTRFYGSKTVTFSILEQATMVYDTVENGFVISNQTDLQNFANIVAGVSKRNMGYTLVDKDGQAYAGDIRIRGILSNDINITKKVKFTGTDDKVDGVIDVKGHTISSAIDYPIDANGVNITFESSVENKGLIKRTGQGTYAIYVTNSVFKLKNMEVNADVPQTSMGHFVWLESGTITLDKSNMISQYGEGIYSNKGNQINIINGSTIDSYNACIFSYSGDINVTNSVMKSKENRTIYAYTNNPANIVINNSRLTGHWGKDSTAITATSSVEAALYLYTKVNLTVIDSEIVGYNTGIFTYGPINISGSKIISKRGILTKDEAQGSPTQRYPEYSIGILYGGTNGESVSVSDTLIETNTITISHIRGFALVSCPDGVRGDLIKLNKPGAITAKEFLGAGQVFYAKNVKDDDTYVNGTVYINDGTAPEATLNGYIEYVLNGATNNPANKDEYELNENSGYLEIKNPICEDLKFEGWYYDEDFTNPVEIQTPVASQAFSRLRFVVAASGNGVAKVGTNFAEYTILYAKVSPYTCEDYGGHDYTKYVSIGNGKHKVVCSRCSDVQSGHQADACTGGTATCTKKATCAKCNVAYGSLKDHAGGAATCSARAKCSTCGAEYGSLAEHTYVSSWTSDGAGHWHACSVCGAKKDFAEHTLSSSITPATLTENGKETTTCSVCGKEIKTTTIYAVKTITLSETTYAYNGKEKTPVVSILDSEGNAIEASNYTLTYDEGRKNVGQYAVTVTFEGNYSGSETLYFVINPPKTSISKLKAGKKAFTVKWAKKTAQVKGYEIQYSTTKDFKSGNKTVKVSSAKTVSKTIKKLTGGKKYYVRIRTYKTVGKINYYSDWSAVKAITTRK